MLSPEQNFRPLSNADLEITYMAEIRALDRVAKLPEFPVILEDVLNYRELLASMRERAEPVDSILQRVNNSKSLIEASALTPDTNRVISTAHLAASSILLENFRFGVNRLRSDQLITRMREYIKGPNATSPRVALKIMEKLHGADTVRIMQMMRLFGFVTRLGDEVVQLGLGAANGSRDIDYAHTEPFVFMETGPDGDEVRFSSMKRKPADVIVSDLDPRYESLYRQMAMNTGPGVTGYVSDVYHLLERLAAGDVRKRNLVTMFRIEPAMLPDLRRFLALLQPVIEDSCDLVMSIGAGDAPDAYASRVSLMSDMYEILQEIGLEPVHIRLHTGGTIMQQAASLQYGNAATASYEVMYCRLDTAALGRALAGQDT